ncbi:hypothetical protein AGLY_007664 [Aphis glycines]|uniref:Uncharacterized protein n=1 Tax=Aphis glycines TaxID=307491 RepID=A0A6G0TNW7_APHGL|nr:hypothetical protein AGLY_007664 [Aphis glycines]
MRPLKNVAVRYKSNSNVFFISNKLTCADINELTWFIKDMLVDIQGRERISIQLSTFKYFSIKRANSFAIRFSTAEQSLSGPVAFSVYVVIASRCEPFFSSSSVLNISIRNRLELANTARHKNIIFILMDSNCLYYIVPMLDILYLLCWGLSRFYYFQKKNYNVQRNKYSIDNAEKHMLRLWLR